MCHIAINEDKIMRHAYLIIAHNNPAQLCVLLKQIDDPRNDIFLHYDKKSNPPPYEMLRQSVKYSKLVVLPNPVAVYWGDYSQIECELLILQTAIEYGEYGYYHLISGQDLLLKSQEYIHAFFERNAGKEFISMEGVNSANRVKYRYKYFYPYLRRIKNLKSKKKKCLLVIWMLIQKICGIDRTRHIKEKYVKGANWFSITDKCARYVLSNREWIEKVFQNTFCCDELFLQTVVYNSSIPFEIFSNPEGENNMRLVDWRRGNPYTFQTEDYDNLMSSSAIFARKFDCNIDGKIIKLITSKELELGQQ